MPEHASIVPGRKSTSAAPVRATRWVVLVTAVLAAACSDSEAPPPGTLSVRSDDGKATLTIPAGALPAGVNPAEVRIEAIPRDAYESFTNMTLVASFRLLPDGLKLLSPAELTIEVDSATAKDPTLSALHVGRESVEAPTLTIRDNGATSQVSAPVSHFSDYYVHTTPINLARTGFLSPPNDATVGSVIYLNARLTIDREESGFRVRRPLAGPKELKIRWASQEYEVLDLRVMHRSKGIVEPEEVALPNTPLTETKDRILLPAAFTCKSAGAVEFFLVSRVAVKLQSTRIMTDGRSEKSTHTLTYSDYGSSTLVTATCSNASDSRVPDSGVPDSGPATLPYLYVMIRDKEDPNTSSQTHTSGVDIDSIELRTGSATHYAAAVKASAFGGGDNSHATNVGQATGPPDATCATTGTAKYVALGGTGGYLIVSFPLTTEITKGMTLKVHECGKAQNPGALDEHYDSFIGVSTNPNASTWVQCHSGATSVASCTVPTLPVVPGP